MGGLEFTWRMVETLIWPVVVIFALLLYRTWITSTVSHALSSTNIKKVKAGPVEVEWESKIDEAARNVAGVLAESPAPVGSDDRVPTDLVDLIPVIAVDPRRGVQAAFRQVRRALAYVYPQLKMVSDDQLPAALRTLVAQGRMDQQVEWAVTQLNELFRMSRSGTHSVESTDAYQFLSMAEGAIHAIIRSATKLTDPSTGARSVPLTGVQWTGEYNNSYRIEMIITECDGTQFRGTMSYPDSLTVTKISGTVRPTNASNPESPGELVWQETSYSNPGRRSIDFDGEYRATVIDNEMTGAWYQRGRRVAEFRMSAAE